MHANIYISLTASVTSQIINVHTLLLTNTVLESKDRQLHIFIIFICLLLLYMYLWHMKIQTLFISQIVD